MVYRKELQQVCYKMVKQKKKGDALSLVPGVTALKLNCHKQSFQGFSSHVTLSKAAPLGRALPTLQRDVVEQMPKLGSWWLWVFVGRGIQADLRLL